MSAPEPAVDWSHSTVLVLTPDSFLRGVGTSILDELLGHGFQEIAARVIQPGKLLLDAIYDDLAQQDIFFGTYRYRAIDALFGLGSSLAIVLSGPPDIHARITAMKGAGPLEDAAADSIRRRYRGINTMLNLLHSSDSAQEAELDWRTFFVREWNNLGQHELPGDLRELSTPGARLLAGLLDKPPNARESRGFPQVRDQFRRTLIAHFWELIPSLAAQSLAVELSAAMARGCIDDGLADRVARAMGGQVDLLVRRALTSAFTPESEPMDTDRLWRSLDGQGVAVDPWSRAVLSTCQYFMPFSYDETTLDGFVRTGPVNE